MALLDDVLTWSENLPPWQRDALRRLFQGQSQLTATDLGEIRDMVEGDKGAPTPVPLTKAHIPTLGAGTTTVLTALTDLQDVNGFPTGRGISLAPAGISVVFGENGAGKSGFARVMKRACRARHSSPVLANAFSKTRTGTPRATVAFSSNGTPTTAKWTEGAASHPDLAMVSVYDSHCAQDYISKDGPCAFLPYGLNVLEALGTAQDVIKQAVDYELRPIRLDRHQFAALSGPHAVGQHVSKLGPQTDLAALTTLSKLDPTEAARIAELQADLKAMDLEPAARAAETLAQRLDGLVRAINLAERFTNDAALDKFAGMAQAEDTAQAADRLAQVKLHGESSRGDTERLGLRDGTGGDAWKILFQAAEAFSRTTYPDHDEHPAHGDGDQCVLCQQPLAPNAQARMQRFRSFVADDAAKNLTEASAAVATALRRVRSADLEPVDDPTLADIRERDPALAVAVLAHPPAWIARRNWIETSYLASHWENARPALPAGDLLSTQFTAKAQALRTWATEHRKARDPKQQAVLQAELTALTARQSLGNHLPAITLFVGDSKRDVHLSAMSTALNTQKISTKITALSKEHVTQALASTLNEELQAIGYKRTVKPKVTSQTRGGTNIVGLALEDCDNEAKDVLSEGEQRAIGLAFFLAEARLRGDASTLVFDDPTTSLDHRHRRRIAKRLVELSASRPIAVLTHDVVFLTAMQHHIAKLTVPHSIQSVQWSSNAPGEVISGLGWESMAYKNQIHDLRTRAATMVKQHGQYANDQEKREIEKGYTDLRGAIERATREIILNDTTHPFVAEVKVINLGGVVGFELAEWETLMNVYGKCSETTSGHDTPPDEQAEIPDAAELAKDLEAVDKVIEACKARRKTFEDGPRKKYTELRNAARKS